MDKEDSDESSAAEEEKSDKGVKASLEQKDEVFRYFEEIGLIPILDEMKQSKIVDKQMRIDIRLASRQMKVLQELHKL